MEFEGFIDLPLHRGSVPPWMFKRMVKLARLILAIMVDEFGTAKVVERLGNPLWFQALSNAIGMDWDSSGSTTVTVAALREATLDGGLGLHVVGGKGKAALSVPEEIRRILRERDLAERLCRISRLVAKVDSAALQDGFSLYHHAIVFDLEGNWAVIQQGMNVSEKLARRYHWVGRQVRDFVRDPHTAVVSKPRHDVINLVAAEAEGCRRAILDIVSEDPRKVITELKRLKAAAKGIVPLTTFLGIESSESVMRLARLAKAVYVPDEKVLEKLRNESPNSFEELLLVRGVGPSLLRSLALLADLVYGEPPSTRDPVTHPYDPFKYAFIVGGKDGVPFPVDKSFYDELLRVVEALEKKIRQDPGVRVAFRRLASIARNWRYPQHLKKRTP